MKARLVFLAVALTASQSAVFGLTPPSADDGPVRLLNCVVSASGVLEAEVENQTDDAMSCEFRCDYELGGKMFSYTFNETVPKRFQGKLGHYDTYNARPGRYAGDMGTCKKMSR
jgi:hypothetical protein